MTPEELRNRTRNFSIRIIKLAKSLKGDFVDQTLAKQVLRSGTSVGANYRAACIAKSQRDFLNKLKIVEEELDETNYWLDIFVESVIVKESKVNSLRDESAQLLKIVTSSILTTKKKLAELKASQSSINKSVNP